MAEKILGQGKAKAVSGQWTLDGEVSFWNNEYSLNNPSKKVRVEVLAINDDGTNSNLEVSLRVNGNSQNSYDNYLYGGGSNLGNGYLRHVAGRPDDGTLFGFVHLLTVNNDGLRVVSYGGGEDGGTRFGVHPGITSDISKIIYKNFDNSDGPANGTMRVFVPK